MVVIRFDDPALFPQYNPKSIHTYCPRHYVDKTDDEPDICTDECQVFVCPCIERDEVRAPGLEEVPGANGKDNRTDS